MGMTGAFLVGAWLDGGLSSDGPGSSGSHIGQGVMIGSILVGIALETHFKHAEMAERSHAFRAYARELAGQLRVCVDGTALVACD